MAADTPNAIQPATPALQVIEATTRNAAASRKRLSRMNRELSLIMLRTSIALRFAQHLPSYRRVLAARRVAISAFLTTGRCNTIREEKCPRRNVC
jgi:hypothetical protein